MGQENVDKRAVPRYTLLRSHSTCARPTNHREMEEKMELNLSNGTLWNALIALSLFVDIYGAAVGQTSEPSHPLDRVVTSGLARAAISKETTFSIDRLGENVLTTEDPRQRERVLGALFEILRKLEEYDIAMQDPIVEEGRALSRLEIVALKDKALSFYWRDIRER